MVVHYHGNPEDIQTGNKENWGNWRATRPKSPLSKVHFASSWFYCTVNTVDGLAFLDLSSQKALITQHFMVPTAGAHTFFSPVIHPFRLMRASRRINSVLANTYWQDQTINNTADLYHLQYITVNPL